MLFFFFLFSCSALENIIIRHILSYRLFLYKATSLYACSSPNNYVTTEHFVMVHVCQHFCRALFPITSISICRITNKCVYNSCACFHKCVCVSSVLYSTNVLMFVGHICIFWMHILHIKDQCIVRYKYEFIHDFYTALIEFILHLLHPGMPSYYNIQKLVTVLTYW